MYSLGIELKGNYAFLALINKKGKYFEYYKASLDDIDDAVQIAIFFQRIKSFLSPYSISSAKLTRAKNITTKANAISIMKMETTFQLLFPTTLKMIDKDQLEYWLSHHLVSYQLTNNYQHALGAAQFEQDVIPI